VVVDRPDIRISRAGGAVYPDLVLDRERRAVACRRGCFARRRVADPEHEGAVTLRLDVLAVGRAAGHLRVHRHELQMIPLLVHDAALDELLVAVADDLRAWNG